MITQEQLNEDVYRYFDSAWGLTYKKHMRDNPVYVDHDITPTPDEYHQKLQGQNPICISSINLKDRLLESRTIDNKVVFSWKNWFIRLYRKVRGLFK